MVYEYVLVIQRVMAYQLQIPRPDAEIQVEERYAR